MNYRMVLYVLGLVVDIEAVALLLPFICGVVYDEPSRWAFLIGAVICLAVGIPLSARKPKDRTMFAKEGFIIVSLSWIVMSLLGALPLVISGVIPNYIDAFFETASGFTTTGASILTDVEALPKCALFWRSFTHWIGGMGVIVFLVSILSLSGGDDFHLIRAESPGHSVSKLVPKVKSTAMILYQIYIAFTVVEVILLLCGGIGLFDALTLSFGTAGTGGFASKNTSIAGYSSYVQIVITVFMAIFGVDFSFYYLLLMRKWRDVMKMEEVRAYFVILLVSALFISLNVMSSFTGVSDTVKHSAFQVVSIMTTTGYATVDFDLWPQFSKTILVFLMFVGACAGSTGGGITVSRFIILIKSIVKELKMLSHPKSVIKVKLNGKVLEHGVLRSINVFFVAYMIVFAFVWLIISLDNFDMVTNFTATAATLSNIGPGLAGVGPMYNYSMFSPLSKIVLSFAMIAGRLELFPVLLLITTKIWKK